MRITPVILSGGAGTRLWPLSTPERPKQFLPLLGERTLLQMTAQRVKDGRLFEPPVLIGSAAHADLIESQLSEVGVEAGILILEPMGRNTAPAIALAAMTANPEALLLVMPSDHSIRNEGAFIEAVGRAASAASEGWLVTFGIKPDYPETGYGYIRQGEEVAPGVQRVDRFVEKPDAATAARYLEEGCYAWNGGIFLFRARTLLGAMALTAPDIAEAVQASLQRAARRGTRLSPDAESFSQVRAQSIDYAVMERAERIAVVPVEMGWSDVGSWDSVYADGAHDADGNLLTGASAAIESKGCLLQSDGPKLVTVGCRDLIVIASTEAVLVVPRGQSQRVKEAAGAASRVGGNR